MKKLKIIYYVLIAISLIQLLAYLFMPYGGVSGILNIIKNGLFVIKDGYRTISLEFPSFKSNSAAQKLQVLNRSLTAAYFASLILCCCIPIFYKLPPKTKYKLGITLGLISLILVFIGGIIWRSLVHAYIEI